MEALWILGFVALWLALQLWILPALGVRTCLSGGCRIEPEKPEKTERSLGDPAPPLR